MYWKLARVRRSFLSRVIETQSGKKLKGLFANIDNYFA